MLIGDLCKASNLSKDTIRHYEEMGLLHSKPRQAGSRTYRDYSEDSFERLELIALGKRLQFSLRELAGSIDDVLSDSLTPQERSARLQVKLEEIDARIAAMQAARDELAGFVARPFKDHTDARLQHLGLSLSKRNHR